MIGIIWVSISSPYRKSSGGYSGKISGGVHSAKNIFCLRIRRIVDPYRTMSLCQIKQQVKMAKPRLTVIIRIYPMDGRLSELRFWSSDVPFFSMFTE
ncbi:MAG: hypothetical protein WCO26_19955 [Deltaproteobacteria bacterium]